MDSAASLQRQREIEISDGIDIVGQDVRYYVKVNEPQQQDIPKPFCKSYRRQLLKGVDLIFKSGQVSAIMGASGAGKTTLLNALACRVNKHNQSGKIYANNDQYNFNRFGEFGNYVMQNDVLYQTLSVRETLQFAADLKLKLSPEQKEQRLSELIKCLKLQKCLDVRIGGDIIKGISGGERKRTSIAFELITNPRVLFLDEPTSGLDSLTAYIIVRYLKKLAVEDKKTIIMTIHQPNSEIFTLFDRLLLMVQGKVVYQNAASKAVEYFSEMGFKCPDLANPPDYIMSILHHESPENVANYPLYFKTYEQKQLPQITSQISQKKTAPVPASKQTVGPITKICTLLRRDFYNNLRNPILFGARIFVSIFIGLILGGLFFNVPRIFYNTSNPTDLRISGFYSIIGSFFNLCIDSLLSSLNPVSITFPAERLIFLKQNGSKMYGVTAYFLSRNLVQLPLSLISPFILSSIVYWMEGLSPTAGQFFTFYLVLVIINIAGASVGLFIGSLVRDPKTVSVVAPAFFVPLFLFGGLFKNRGDFPAWIGWFEYISPIKYGFNALALNQFPPGSGDMLQMRLIDRLEFDLGLWEAIGILAALSLVIRLLSLFFLSVLRTRLQ